MNNIHHSRRRFLQTVAFAGASGLSGAFPGVAYSAAENTLTVRFADDFGSLDPGYYSGGSPEADINWCIMPALVHLHNGPAGVNWVRSPYVEDVTVKDARHIDFTLKPGLMWTNGFGELTAEDVAFSYDRMAKSEYGKGYYFAYDHVEIKDRYSGTIVLNQPFLPFISVVLAAETGIILSKKAMEAVGGKYTVDPPATCGPYLHEYKQGQWVKFRPNPNWKGPKPAYKNIDCFFISEHSAATLAYEAGEIDCAMLGTEAYARYQSELPSKSELALAGFPTFSWLGLNTEHPKLKDIRVRKAIQHAVQQDSIIQGAYWGVAEPSFGIIPPGLVGRRLEAGYTYDPAMAKRLLSEAGVSNLKLSLRTFNEQERVLAAQIIQANLSVIGIDVEIIPLDSGPFWDMGQESKGDTWKDLELWISLWGAGLDPYESFQWFLREQVGIWNWERWTSDEFEKLHLKGIAETDTQKRHNIYIRMQEIMEETGAYVWLVHEPRGFIHRADIRVQILPTGEMQLANFEPK